jgi:hypothetical protein
MRGVTFNSGLKSALLLSVLLHAGVGFVAVSVPVGAESETSQARAGMSEGSTVSLFDPADQNPPKITESDRASQPLTAAILEQDPPKALTPEEIERKLTLGIDESDQKTANWIGFANPTEHMAKLSGVEQPQLDRNPGSSGAPAIAGVNQSAPRPTLFPDALPGDMPIRPADAANARPAHDGDPSHDPSKPVADKASNGAPEGRDRTDAAMPREGEDLATGEKLSRPKRGVPDATRPGFDGPGPASRERGKNGSHDQVEAEDAVAETPRKIEPMRATTPREESPARPIPPDAPAGVQADHRPAAPMSEAGANLSSTPGQSGERPGERSPKEADASSTTPSVEIRPGRPAAAQGLDITTKRPIFTRLTRVTAYPDNPLLKVTFNRAGIVSKVEIVESSGLADVDGPVVNAIYQWTAKGKTLADLAAGDPSAGITLSVRILLH